MGLRRITLVYENLDDPVDGIRDYSLQLAAALRDSGLEVGLRSMTEVRDLLDRGEGLFPPDGGVGAGDEAVVVQYAPFAYAHWGFTPWLVHAMWRLRRARPRRTIGLTAHETYQPPRDLRTGIFALWQAPQLLGLSAASDHLFATVESYVPILGRTRPRRPVHHLPTGSTLPDRRRDRGGQRESLGVGEDTFVLGAFGTGRRDSRLMDYLDLSARALAQSGQPVALLNLGAGAPEVGKAPRAYRPIAPGRTTLDGLAGHLSAVDLFLAPFGEGAATNRTTLMAAFQHGLPVVGTDGPRTGAVLRDAPQAIRLVPVDRGDLFAREVCRLADAAGERWALGAAGRSLYESRFDWPVVARRLVAALES